VITYYVEIEAWASGMQITFTEIVSYSSRTNDRLRHEDAVRNVRRRMPGLERVTATGSRRAD
jgi:hypothetical protein